ncbi:tyrosine-type recombinase/integrase [Halomicrobium mukohataei]|uniref:Integrase n=2 Tax=Halomicrobium mukohataei TaxID=57705 RepID=C7P516_HALMD|nr:hypothetical protein [Halomicrobium mukohataei]ACV49411.1 conserved hypothetical protein [Halomicrobium mukohataei DSM 12286]QCD67238.1 hypothetical protein E5139_16465 [Halomicrobium mukohataei]
MTASESGGSDGEDDLRDALDAYLRSKGKGPNNESGAYRRNAERELERFADYLRDDGTTSLAEIDAGDLRNYIRDELTTRGLKPQTVHKYYGYVSAWIGWAQREGLVDEHYGIRTDAREPLPDRDGRTEERQQTWRREDREAFLSYLDERAHEAIDADGTTAYAATRDRALAYLLAFAGVRGAEVLAMPDDDRRDGANAGDLSNAVDALDVLGKSQAWETRAVPPQARPAIERWLTVYDPEPEWPLFPSFHYPSLYDRLSDDVDSDALSGYSDIFAAFRDTDARPPALTTDGARRLFKRLCADAAIEVAEGYLQLHGARRGVGRVLALQQGIDAAADQLDNSPEVVREAYSEVLASERAAKTGDAFEQHDGDE